MGNKYKLRTCGNCKFFHVMNLECRRHTPVAEMCTDKSSARTFDVHKAVFPKINKNDWCGEIELLTKS